jgi:alkaline phosphatase D
VRRELFPQSVASGDPRPDSIILWTRVVDAGRPGEGLSLTLQVAYDEDFERMVLELGELSATAEHDHIVKVKVTNLSPRTRYFYRFLYSQGKKRFSSPVGRTRTAPSSTMEVPVRFAIGNCQDFNGRYYNSWQRLLQLDEDLDVIVFLGDYIYEGIPSTSSGPRTPSFSDPGSALVLDGGAVLAAASLSNYRDLYKTYRSDAFLQQVHERYPFVLVWDDHEFSNDCWDAHATYTNGRQEELQVERRRNAELAFFEYLPIDPSRAPAGLIDVDTEPRYPDTRLWRDFIFGRHLRLLVTDYRTHRPDHLIPEGAYPAQVAVDAAALDMLGLTDAFARDAFAYVNIGDYPQQRTVLVQVYQQLAMQAGLTEAEAAARADVEVRGSLALAYVNPVLAQAGLPPIDPAGKLRGIAFVHMGKSELFTSVGSRSVVVKDTFDVYAAWRSLSTGGAAQNALGTAQESWLLEAAENAQTWKVVVSSVSLTSMVWDLRNKPDVQPPSVRNRYYLSVDQWDGFPDKKRELLTALRARSPERLLFVSGDIHAAFASVEQGVPALTAPAISSSAIQEELGASVEEAGFPPDSAVYRYLVTEGEATLREGNPGIAFVDTGSHGFTVVEVRSGEVRAAYHLISSTHARESHADRGGELASRFSRRDFLIQGGVISPL